MGTNLGEKEIAYTLRGIAELNFTGPAVEASEEKNGYIAHHRRASDVYRIVIDDPSLVVKKVGTAKFIVDFEGSDKDLLVFRGDLLNEGYRASYLLPEELPEDLPERTLIGPKRRVARGLGDCIDSMCCNGVCEQFDDDHQ